jgi:hypothetical protein
MTGSQTFPALTRQTLEEHQQIHFYLDQLERSLRGLALDPVAVETLRRLAAQIDGLRERLVEHFGVEESGGLFRALSDLMPETRDEIRVLSEQHVRALEALEMSRIRAHYGEPGEAGVLRADLESFVRILREHERREESLLIRALEHDHQA